MQRRCLIAILGLASLLVRPDVAEAQVKARYSNLGEALDASFELAGGDGPADVRWIDGGARFSYIAVAPGTDREQIRAYDVATARDTLVFDATGHTFPGSREPFRYDSFQWSADSRHLVFRTHFEKLYRRSGTADYYVYSLVDHSLRLVARGAHTAELSPDGARLGYERDGAMFVYDMRSGADTQLTSGASDTVYDGHFDWAYEEEFGMPQAWNWSPDSRHIAFWRTDAGEEPIVQITDYAGRHPDWERLRIPQPGDSNAVVRIGVADVASGKLTWLDPGLSGDYYIPRIYWTSAPDTLAVLTLNRQQNEIRLFFFDVRTGGRRLVLTQRSDTWIDVYDFYARVNDLMEFPPGEHEFLWLSDRDGWQHIYRYDYSGRLIAQVTHGRWSVTRIEGVDPQHRTIYFTSTQASPLQRQLYAIHFDGSAQRRLTGPDGRHRIDMSPDTHYYIDRYSSTRQPRQVELWRTGGAMLRKLEDNAGVSSYIATHVYSPVRLFSFVTSDSARLDASMILPVPFDSTRRYPVVFGIYGGPGSQQVFDAFSTSGWNQWLAQHGYIVVDVNNRGNANYGSAFEKVVYRQLGRWESHDFAETARYLATLPYVDAAHMAIMGSSYGGYSTCYTMLAYPGVFVLGIADAAVTDWRLYDSIYTERYMGLLADNPDGYRRSSCVENAARLQGRLLLIHSMRDDNVHPQNTMQLLTALANAGKDVDLRLFPPGAHGAFYSGVTELLGYQIYDRYLGHFLKGEPVSPDVNR
jgi:dipeptidyl-peptidase 4